MEVQEGFTCNHCKAYIPVLDIVHTHECFIDKDVYMENNNILFVNENLDVNDNLHNNYQKITAGIHSSEQFKQNKSAVWTDNATMALLSLYKANMHMLDHPKKKAKIWTAISDGLKDFEIENTSVSLYKQRRQGRISIQ